MNFNCEICQIGFSTKFSLNRHQKSLKCQSGEIKLKLSQCNDCDVNFSKKTLLIDHLNKVHGLSINKQIIEFTNVLEFQAWKRDYELKNGIEYIQNTGQKKCKDGQRYYYECCRTGFHKEGENLKRMIKTQGSKKINQNCTSHIILFESFEGKCEVTFYKEHYGHKEIELQHIKIPDIKKHEIAAKLSQDVTFKRVLDDVRENIGNSLKRDDLITRSDLHNIKQKYNLNLKDGQFHKSDATSVDIWVEQMKKEEENNCVIYYKRQGEVDDRGMLDLKDFCIILMDPGEKYMLHKFGQQKT